MTGVSELKSYDVLVVGKGNAALCAALAARDDGARVAMLEAAAGEHHGLCPELGGLALTLCSHAEHACAVKDQRHRARLVGDLDSLL